MTTRVSSPSRLHFGLLSVGKQVDREFGGIGMMIQGPRTTVHVATAEQFSLVDHCDDAAFSDRIASGLKIVDRWLAFARKVAPDKIPLDSDHLPVCLSIESACPRHNGLGSGTQLALTIALALQHHFQLPRPKPDELAIALGRAGRSAIGTWGCFEGGFFVDRGKTQHTQVAPIDLRLDFPSDWPIALIFSQPLAPEPTASQSVTQTQSMAGLHGTDERVAFESIPATTSAQLQEMRGLVRNKIVPALVDRDYETFADGLQIFGRRSGDYFSAVQGGTFASPRIEQIIELIADSGVPAVGQTSWGPCVFAISPNIATLETAVARVKQRLGDSCSIQFTYADNSGTRISHP